MENRRDAQFGAEASGMSGDRTRSRLALWLIGLFAAFALALAGGSPALAHGGKKHDTQAQPAQQQAGATGASAHNSPAAQQQVGSAMSDMEGGMDMNMDRSKMSFGERLVGWFGRLHPAIVHFPIAFFPAAWFTAIVGRRRPAFASPVQFLVVAGGIFAPIAAIAGWITAADADPSNILTWHRWLGTGVGVVGLLLGIWAWRRPWEDRGAGMIAALTIMTIVVIVQAGLGASITHGVDHLLF